MFDFFNTEEKVKAKQRKIAALLLIEKLADCRGSCDVGVVIGAAELAEKLGLINHNEFLLYHGEAYRLNKIHEDRRKAEYQKKAAERKAERAAKAKAEYTD